MEDLFHTFLCSVQLFLWQQWTIASSALPEWEASKPHIVFMLVDHDWGWADVGYHRTTQTQDIVTPNIDSLVVVGLQLDQHYVYYYFSPSHAALLSGRVASYLFTLMI